jgi:hypothetical protein
VRNFITIDDSKFPIVVGRYQKFIPTQEEFVNSQEIMESFCLNHENYVFLIDFSEMPILSTEYRIAQAKWTKKCDPLFVRQKAKLVFYTPSITARIMLKTYLLLFSPSIPYTMTSSLEKAYAWAATQIKLKNPSEKI